MERITLRTYLRDKAMDRDEDVEEAGKGAHTKWHRTNGQAMPASAKVKPRWVVIRRKDKKNAA